MTPFFVFIFLIFLYSMLIQLYISLCLHKKHKAKSSTLLSNFKIVTGMKKSGMAYRLFRLHK